MRPRAVDVVHENPIINSTWRLRGPQDGPSIDAEHKLLARPSTHALLPHCKMAWARPLPDAWARPFTSIRTLYLMPMLLSKHPPCQSLGNVHCLLTTPKTGSSALKTGFQLPVALDARRRGADACRHVLVPYRDPISRFISGVGTVHGRCSYRGPREYMANANRCAGVRTNGSLTTMVDFEAYARLLLTSVRGHMARCTDAQMLAHLLPQAVFAAAVPPDATLYGMTVEAASRPAVQDLHASSASASACAPLVTHKVNAEEGVGTAPVIRGLNETMLPGGLLEAIVRTYAADYAWLGMPLPPSVAAIGGLDSPGPTSLPTATSSREVEQPTEETTTPRLVRPPVRAVREPAIAGGGRGRTRRGSCRFGDCRSCQGDCCCSCEGSCCCSCEGGCCSSPCQGDRRKREQRRRRRVRAADGPGRADAVGAAARGSVLRRLPRRGRAPGRPVRPREARWGRRWCW